MAKINAPAEEYSDPLLEDIAPTPKSVGPKVGDIITYNDGVIDRAAIVTFVWSKTCVNLMVFHDPSHDGDAMRLGHTCYPVEKFIL